MVLFDSVDMETDGVEETGLHDRMCLAWLDLGKTVHYAVRLTWESSELIDTRSFTQKIAF